MGLRGERIRLIFHIYDSITGIQISRRRKVCLLLYVKIEIMSLSLIGAY